MIITDYDNAPAEELIVNQIIKVKGNLQITIHKDINDIITIEGVLTTGYYEADIRNIETVRYFVDDVDVIEEHYDSNGDEIVYKFTAQNVIVKYQLSTEEYSIIQ